MDWALPGVVVNFVDAVVLGRESVVLIVNCPAYSDRCTFPDAHVELSAIGDRFASFAFAAFLDTEVSAVV